MGDDTICADPGTGARQGIYNHVMPRFSAEQIYAFARKAGFSPDESATMTAVALAESGGNSRAHNQHGEDSRGLWQINARAHPDLAQKYDLYDPHQNARAAFEVSAHGADISPWTTTHGGHSARYLRYRDEAESAAAAHGDGHGLGSWAGTRGYGDSLAASSPGQGHGRGGGRAESTHSPAEGSEAVVNSPVDSLVGARVEAGAQPRAGEDYGIALDAPDARRGADYGIPLETSPETADAVTETETTALATATPAGADALAKFLDAALAQSGDTYRFGAEVALSDRNPSAFDCSELVQWAAHQAGVEVADGAWWQYREMQQSGTLIPVADGIHTRGALLFSFSSDPSHRHSPPAHSHVAISLGDGQTIEARGTRYGVGTFEASAHRFQYAALIPGIAAPRAGAADGGEAVAVAAPEAPEAPEPAHDSSREFERRLALDPHSMDNDRRYRADSEELLGVDADRDPPPHDAHAGHPTEAPHQDDGPDDHAGHRVDGVDGHSDDLNVDGLDDSIAEAAHWSTPSADDPHTFSHGD
jgi:cell wall-associated NlpC family hydrolase